MPWKRRPELPRPDREVDIGHLLGPLQQNNKAQKVFDEAIKYFGLNTTGGTYVLRREADNRSLALGEKLEDLGLVDGDVLLLQTSQAQDG